MFHRCRASRSRPGLGTGRAGPGPEPECNWAQEALAQKLGANKAKGQFLDLRYLSAPKGRSGNHYHPIRPPCPSAVFLRGWTQEKITEVVGISQGRVAQIINNTSFGKTNNLVTQGRDMDYIARHYHKDLALARQTYGGLAWALLLEGKTDQKKI